MHKILALTILIVLAACSPTASSDPTRDPQLPKTITATDNTSGVIRIEYPGDWLADALGDATINVGNSGLAIRNYRDDITHIESGQVVGTVSALTKRTLPEIVDDDVASVMRFVTGTISAPTEGTLRYTFGSIQASGSGDQAVAVSDGLGTGADLALDLRVVVVDAGAAYGILFFSAPFDELQTYWSQIDQIAASFEFFTAEAVRATQTAVASPTD